MDIYIKIFLTSILISFMSFLLDGKSGDKFDEYMSLQFGLSILTGIISLIIFIWRH